MVPEKPWPLEIPDTSSLSPASNCETVNSLPTSKSAAVVKLELLQMTGGFHTGFFKVADLGLGNQFLHAVFRDHVKSDLNGLIAVGLNVLFLHYFAGTGPLPRLREQRPAVIGKDLRHADLFSYDRFFHDNCLPLLNH